VKVPYINNGTVIYVYYGNSTIASSMQNPQALWADYKGVWHLTTVNDSTANAVNLTNTGTVSFSTTSPKIYTNADYGSSNTSKYLVKASNNLGILGGGITMQSWVKIGTAPANSANENIIEQQNSSKMIDYRLLYAADSSGNKSVKFVRDKIGSGWQEASSASTLTTGTWYHVAMTYNGTNIQGYLNGALVATAAASGDGTAAAPNEVAMGVHRINSAATSDFLKGMMDEARISELAMSADRIATEYNNQNDPATFWSLGSEEGGCNGGASAGGYCWFLGEANQSCTDVCTAHSATYNSTGTLWGGSSGTDANCSAVLTGLGAGSGAVTALSGSTGVGCGVYASTRRQRINSPATTNIATAADLKRACACHLGSGCAGASVGGYCWYYGADGDPCTGTCSGHGGYNAATSTYAGSGGSNANCDSVLTALGVATGTVNASSVDGLGCCTMSASRYRDVVPTTEGASWGGARRACACNN
jgi:hypothetical protein